MKPSRPSAAGGWPDVVVDFHLEEGCLFLAVSNLGDRPAHAVTTTFDPSFSGLGGDREIPGLALFDGIGFLPPGKTVRAFVDRAASYFARDEPAVIDTEVSFEDDAGRELCNRATHDLGIYRDLPAVTSLADPRTRPNSFGDLGGWGRSRPSRSPGVPSDGGGRGTFELYEDKAGEYRWRLVHPNGNIIADSGEGYSSARKARQGLASVREHAAHAGVEDQT